MDKTPEASTGGKPVQQDDRISGVFDMLKRDGVPPLSIEQINQIVAKAWAGEQ